MFRLHANTWSRILKETTELGGPFGTMSQEPWHPEKGAKPDRVIQLNCGEVCTHASYKTARTWKNFNNWGTKVILLRNEPWLQLTMISILYFLITSIFLQIGSKPITKNNLSLRKCSEIYLI